MADEEITVKNVLNALDQIEKWVGEVKKAVAGMAADKVVGNTSDYAKWKKQSPQPLAADCGPKRAQS